jgi:hypothetical protein
MRVRVRRLAASPHTGFLFHCPELFLRRLLEGPADLPMWTKAPDGGLLWGRGC